MAKARRKATTRARPIRRVVRIPLAFNGMPGAVEAWRPDGSGLIQVGISAGPLRFSLQLTREQEEELRQLLATGQGG